MNAGTCIYDLGIILHKKAWKEVSIILDNELKSSEIGDLDYQLSGLLSYVEKSDLPNDLNNRFERIRSFDKALEHARYLCKNDELARTYINYLDMKRSWALYYFSSKLTSL